MDDTDDYPSFGPKNLQEYVEGTKMGIFVGVYQYQLVTAVTAFQEVGGIVQPPLDLPEALPSQPTRKRKFADAVFGENEDTEEEIRPAKIAALAWHPFRPKLSVALENRGVVFFDQSTQEWSPLTIPNKEMGKISDMLYHPLGACLGIACNAGIALWRFRPEFRHLPETNISGVHMNLFKMPGAKGLCFSPCGEYVVGWSGSVVRIFGCAGNGKDSIKLSTSWSPVTSCEWGSKGLVVVHGKKVFIYNTKTWKPKSYSSPQQIVNGFSTNQGSILLSRTTLQCIVNTDMDITETIGIGFAMEVPGVQSYDLFLRQAVLSPCKTRLAFLWDASACVLSKYVGLVAIENGRVHPIGFIHGEDEWGRALECTFQKVHPGNLLTIAWSSGKVSFCHLHS